MVVARELALRGWRVILLERSRGLGGTAGSDIKNGFMRKIPQSSQRQAYHFQTAVAW